MCRREVYPEKALLRLCHYSKLTPQSDRVTAAGHLINLALHSVVSRMQQQVDPRMSALKSVSSLQSLHVGDISKYKWGGRQPVRRRRGDVHGDMSLLAVRLHWAGGLLLCCCFHDGQGWTADTMLLKSSSTVVKSFSVRRLLW